MRSDDPDVELKQVCRRAGSILAPARLAVWAKIGFPLCGLLALLWFLVRVIPKPSRATYPCMRVAAPLASSFVVWLLGLGGAAAMMGTARRRLSRSHYVLAGTCGALSLAMAWLGLSAVQSTPAWALLTPSAVLETPDPVNDPIGIARGCHPGRVAWVYDAEATDWAGPGMGDGYCWDAAHTDQDVVDSMMSRAVQWLAGQPTDAAAWDALFKHFNGASGKGDVGYQPGEKIAIKINLTTCNAAAVSNPPSRVKTSYLESAGDTSPQMVLALLRQLVNVAGVAQSDISVGDTVAAFPQQWYDCLAPEFPNVHYIDHYPFEGRTQVQHSATPLYWSTPNAVGKEQDLVPVTYAEADYLINFAVLKGHAAGITVCSKNLYGSMIRTPDGIEWGAAVDYYNLHDNLPSALGDYGLPGRGFYRPQVDLMGDRDVGGKTVLYLIDGLYGGYYWSGTPYKWNMTPFDGDWPSSLFASQDPVAIDSVAYDFLNHEWPDVVSGGPWGPGALEGAAQDYLHEAALANDPPSETFYDPEDDGARMESLGVHEHWNNSTDKQYSRNIGTGAGIELISSPPPMPVDLHVQSSPVSGVPMTGTPAGTTDYTAQLEEGAAVSVTAPANFSTGGSDYDFARWTLDGLAQPDGQTIVSFNISQETTAVAVFQPAQANQPPLASALPDDQMALVGERVHFDGGSSSDPDGRIVRYEWDCDGDGSYESSGRKTSHVYSSEGNYVAGLRVTDDLGATGTDTCTVMVITPTMHIGAVDLAARAHGKRVTVGGSVAVRNQFGAGVRRATVQATWSVNGSPVLSQSAVTKGRGNATLELRSDSLTAGDLVTLSVDDVVAGGYVYDPASNVEDSGQVIVP